MQSLMTLGHIIKEMLPWQGSSITGVKSQGQSDLIMANDTHTM